MSRRVSLPGASELFRPTHSDSPAHQKSPNEPATGLSAVPAVPDADPFDPGPFDLALADETVAKPAGGTGRVRHDEKITVYVSSEELLGLERARLELRARHGLAVDRGRLVREAIAALLSDFEAEGEGSRLVRRLSS